MTTKNAEKNGLLRTLIIITLAVTTSSSASAFDTVATGTDEPDVVGEEFDDPGTHGLGGSGSGVHLEGQGTITAIFKNVCSGYRQVGINTNISMDGGDGGGEDRFSISHPGQQYSRDKLWLDCGDSVIKTVKYDFPRVGDYQFKGISSTVSYRDNFSNHQRFTTPQPYNWTADGTVCTVSYIGYMPPVADISCSQQ